MNIWIFTIILISALLLLLFSRFLPAPKWVVFISGSMILLLGILSIGQGLGLESTILKTSFIQNIGLMLSLFGFGINVQAVF
jgi:hypothetical protein